MILDMGGDELPVTLHPKNHNSYFFVWCIEKRHHRVSPFLLCFTLCTGAVVVLLYITQKDMSKGGGHNTYNGKIMSVRDNGSSADLIVRVDDQNIYRQIVNQRIRDIELDIKDINVISAEQRKKIYACLKDISYDTGYSPDETKQVMKYYYLSRTGGKLFSLADCTRDVAREFINVLIDFCLENGIQTSDTLLERTDDIDRYLWQCLKHKKCAICGKQAEIHHWDAIGMGNDRRTYDDSQNRKIALCRLHHTIAHQKGRESFQRAYHVYGIVYVEKCVDGEE